jgi:asparagine N-glycosylation enzyme membrane subunit Stt3
MSALLTAIIAFISIIVPGFFLALALLRKTKLNMIEIGTIGFIFGLIFPPVLTWLESYLINYIHAFSFSAGLYAVNVVLLTIVGIALCVQQGVLNLGFFSSLPERTVISQANKAYKQRLNELRAKITALDIGTELIRKHKTEEEELVRRHAEENSRMKDLPQAERARIEAMHAEEERKLIEEHEREEHALLKNTEKKSSNINLIWVLLLFLMLFTFATRMMSIGIAPKFFEFDPYFDMQSTEFLLIHGYQWLYDHSAWPTAINGTPHRIEPIVPYLEAYWYQISNPPASQISTTLLSDVGSVYPPITAALLVFIVFLFLYHSYGEYPAIIGATLAAAMPALITTFIAGEQLVEPWGIFAMFFFYAAYLLAVQNPKEMRFAILAGIAFASSFLGAHYYTVTAGVFAICIAGQGVVNVFKKSENVDFYKMNAVVIAISAIFFLLFDPYNTVLTNKIPGVLGIPVIIAFPLVSLIFVALFEYGPVFAKKRKLIASTNIEFYIGWLVVLGLIGLLLIAFTPLGKSVTGYLALSSHFTTPSIPLFMTVQEYQPTGFNFDFGSAGFGPIGASAFGVNALVWFVLILFTIMCALAIYNRDSKVSILALAAVWPLAIAGMIEIKYLPHFGVGYILAFCIIVGELLLMVKGKENKFSWNLILIVALVVVLLEATSFINLFSAAGNTCSTISSQGNSLGFDLYCNTLTNQWLTALAWMKQNVGPTAPRILSWWDYGDWINWFGNSNAVLRGDNSIALLDYATAARFVLGSKDGYGPANLVNFSNNVVYAKYVLFDDQLLPKWQALDFLACVDANQTSRAFAISQANGTGQPYVLGTSQCELTHSPAYLLVPENTNNINNYCTFAKGNISALKTLLLADNGVSNQTYCAPTNFTNGAAHLLYPNGTKTNILIMPTTQFYAGLNDVGGQNFLTFIAIYVPNGPNDTITDAPTKFYSSNYYRGFYLGSLPGFTMVYPKNFTGINFVNMSQQVVIYEVNNYTGPNPYVTPKPAWVQNNFTMPG